MYKEVLEWLIENKRRRESGEIIAIPFGFPRLSEYLPGILQGNYYGVTASSKVGKSQFADYLFVYEPIEWYIRNKENTDISLKIIYNSLEMSKRSKALAAMSYKLFREFQIQQSPQELSSVFKDKILPDDIKAKLESKEFVTWFEEFEKIVTYFDSVRNPTGIYKLVESYAHRHGKYTYKDIDWQMPDGSFEKRKVRDKYIPENSNKFVEIITDHISLLSPEKNETLHKTMGKYSSNYCLHFRDIWNYIPINIHQQAADSEKEQFTYRGDSIVDKLKPTAEGLANNKEVGRDYNLLLSLFHPAKYEIEEYKNWNLSKIGRNYRELSILSNRNGESNLSVPLYFNGRSNFFKELPKEPSEQIYEIIDKLNIA